MEWTNEDQESEKHKFQIHNKLCNSNNFVLNELTNNNLYETPGFVIRKLIFFFVHVCAIVERGGAN